MSIQPTRGIDYTSKDYEAFRAMMLEKLSELMPEYTDHSQTDAGIVILELLAMGLDILSFYQDSIANEALLPTAEQRNSVLKWCNILSYYPRQATPSKIKQVFKLSSVQSEDFTIPAYTVIRTQGTTIEPAVYFETAEDLVIPAGSLGDEQGDDDYLYSVDAIQGLSILGELLGSSNGSKNQKYTLKYTPVIQDSVKIFVNGGSGFEAWTQVKNFVESSPEDKHYTVTINDNDEATITFGNGVFGKIPPAYVNGIFADYRTGGGSSGNVGANKVTVIDSPLALVESTFNPYLPFEQGIDKESIESIKINAPNAHRTLWGATTIEDFAEIVLLNVPEVVLADSLTDAEDKYSVVIYAFSSYGDILPDTLEQKILDLFDKDKGGRMLAGLNKVTVKNPTFTPTNFTISLIVKDKYSRSSIEAQIKEYLTDFFKKGNYRFNQKLSLSELSANLMNPENAIGGILSVKITEPSEDVITPPPGVLYTLGSVTINSSGGVE